MQNPPQGPHDSPTGPTNPPQHMTQPGYPPQYPTQPIYPPPYPPQQPPYPPQQPPYPPQQPPYPSLYPAPVAQNVYFQNQSFTGKAVTAFLLYFLGYIPGLIFNIMFLMEAHRVQGETGRTPSGYGCLWATLLGSLIPAALLAGLVFLIIVALASSGGGAPS